MSLWHFEYLDKLLKPPYLNILRLSCWRIANIYLPVSGYLGQLLEYLLNELSYVLSYIK